MLGLTSPLPEENFHMPLGQLDHVRWAEKQSKDPTCKVVENTLGLVVPFNSRQMFLYKIGSYPAPSQDEALSPAIKGDLLKVPLTTRPVTYQLIWKATLHGNFCPCRNSRSYDDTTLGPADVSRGHIWPSKE